MLISQPSIMWAHGGFWLRAEAFCCLLLLLFPKVTSLALLTWALYACVLQLVLHYQRSVPLGLLLALVAALYVLCLYAYYMVIWVGPGLPLDFPELKVAGALLDAYSSTDDAQQQLLPRDEPLYRSPPEEYFATHTFKNNAPAYRWCSTCEVWKPDRCHHCSTCRRCFLRMDHHCPWYACCIGFRNHKFFIQLLMYMTAFSSVMFSTSGVMLYQFFTTDQFENAYLLLNLVFLFVVSFAFTVALACFTVFLMYMVAVNQTTIEFQDLRWNYLENKLAQYEFDANGKKVNIGNIYDLGLRANWCSVMGPHWYDWVFPTAVTDTRLGQYNNGVNFMVDEEAYSKHCYNAQLQEQLNRQLHEYRDRVRGTHAHNAPHTDPSSQ